MRDDPNEQRVTQRVLEEKREGSGAQAFSWWRIVKTNMARQPGVCPKRHAKLSAIVVKP
jgi:hypothetical protein